MAHAAIIDREALQEYKSLNRKRLGLSTAYTLAADLRTHYLQSLMGWLDAEKQRVEVPYSISQDHHVFIPPLIRHKEQPIKLADDDTAIFEAISSFVSRHRKCLLLGNGGIGKTVTLINWLQYQCNIALTDGLYPIPVFVPLYRLTINSNLKALIRGAFAKLDTFLDNDQIEALLVFGDLCIVLDGLNEISKPAVDAGAIKDILNLVEGYPQGQFIVSSRYVPYVSEWRLPRLEMDHWDSQRVERYLIKQLGAELGRSTYRAIGSDLDFEWLSGCSIVGLYSNPFTLAVLATVTQEKKSPPERDDTIIDMLVDLAISGVIKRDHIQLSPSAFRRALEDFAYLMIAEGSVVSISYANAIELIAQIVSEGQKGGLIPRECDSYQLLAYLLRTGLVRQPSDDMIEWLHQILQEKLSIKSSDRRFGNAIALAAVVKCPTCGSSPIEYSENDGELWGQCDNTEQCGVYRIPLPKEIYDSQLKDKLKFVDHTGAPFTDGATSIPNSFIDERWMAYTPSGKCYWLALRFAQDISVDSIDKSEFLYKLGQPALLSNFELLVLVKAGILSFEQLDDTTAIHVFTAPVNPSLRLTGYKLCTLRELSLKELGETPEERFDITSDEFEAYLDERRKKNLPIFHYCEFVEDEKEKVFQIARKFGGQVIRLWGPYEDVVAEFAGEAWDFSGYTSEE